MRVSWLRFNCELFTYRVFSSGGQIRICDECTVVEYDVIGRRKAKKVPNGMIPAASLEGPAGPSILNPANLTIVVAGLSHMTTRTGVHL